MNNWGRRLAVCLAYCCLCRSVFLGAEVSARHLGTSADMSGQFGTSAEVSYGHFGTSAEMSGHIGTSA